MLFLFLFLTTAHAELPIIDAHVHASFSGGLEDFSKIPMTEEQFFKELKEINGVGAVAHGHDGVYKHSEAIKKLPVFQCYGLRANASLAKAEKALKAKEARCIKVYLGYVHKYAYDKSYRPFYKLAEKYDVPVVFHTGDTYSQKAKLKYADPLTIDEVAVDFPKTTFVMAHLGNPWIDSAMEVTYKNPNVYVDLSALLIGDTLKDAEAVEGMVVQPVKKAFAFVGDPNKFLFGSDWPLSSLKDSVESIKKSIPQKHWCKVFYENAKKVFRMTEITAKCEI
jgi:predicted TIM-barrel fold metal-dependent hydrolase